MTRTLTPVRPGLHRQMLDFSACHCHCHWCRDRDPSPRNDVQHEAEAGGLDGHVTDQSLEGLERATTCESGESGADILAFREGTSTSVDKEAET